MLKDQFAYSFVLMLRMIHIYGIIYLIGDYNLVRRGRIKLIGDRLSINVGIRKTISFDIEEIESIKEISNERELVRSSKSFWVVATPLFYKSLIGFQDEINCQITLKSQVRAYGFLGKARNITHINLSLDYCQEFVHTLKGEHY
ncbi:hypothetical protein [Cohnella abietis]|uniref:Uncharacterized protein n=1 Tax=Cohnella abietis TaxID=2507935 RepID=A0A3T1DEF5_9BACL|nr:hypothetical protein [Cohnella abietis]BBI36479.1 hypothetical protein KCTCHS21_58780 [Cohnella abietis]